ncbi:hypothetical protein MVEN_00448000 [Mycena venus]|uniref:Uncharacterized protein n=1 Tax=Mycena venus TaxID=2733690 RepID=A0A8H7DAM2_9AGAR|nr:hypothetical protein MVEN_00448000 [Mycena venus]
MNSPSLLAVNIAAVIGETLLYGILLALFFVNICIRSSWYQSPENFTQQRWNPVFLIFTIALLFCCTAHWLLTIASFLRAVLLSAESHTALIFYVLFSPLEAAAEIVNFSTICLGDAVVIYRLWIVWCRDLRVTVPAVIIWVTFLAVGSVFQHEVLVTFYQRHESPTETLIIANFVMTLAANIYCTVLIAWRVWTQTRAKELMFVVSVLIESAALYTAWTLFTIISSKLGFNIQGFAVGLTAQVIGLTNMLIYLRVGLEPRTSTPTQEETGIVMTTLVSESDECHSGSAVPDLLVRDKSNVLRFHFYR